MCHQNPANSSNEESVTEGSSVAFKRAKEEIRSDLPHLELPVNDHPLRPFIDLPMEDIISLIADRCRRNLAWFPSIDADDAVQDSLLQILKYSFIKNYDPNKGAIWAYVYKTTDRACWHQVRVWRRHLRERSSLDIAEQLLATRSPEDEAVLREILDDIKLARNHLSQREREALPDILETTHGSRYANENGEPPNYSATCRCRKKLRHLLARHGQSP